MNRVDQLLENYRSHLKLPQRASLPAIQRTWFAVYPASEERRLLLHLYEFEHATRDAGLDWRQIDLQGCLSQWIDGVDPDEREAWMRDPEAIELYAENEWRDLIVDRIREGLATAKRPHETVFAVTGLMELFDLLHVSDVLEKLEDDMRGFLLVFFPGEREGNTYRFLNARVGWDYLATPILSAK